PGNDMPLCNTTLFNTLPITPHTVPPYYYPATGAIRIELNEPDYAFGNDLYAINLMNAVIHDLPSTTVCEAYCKSKCGDNQECFKQCMEECLTPKELNFPLPPYVPSASFLTVSYTCSTSLHFNLPFTGNNRFYHLYPFGGYQL